ncbi:hypothetical protein B9Z65_8145 [Elsinoe australis]|uniref:Uncharacterized protein n=1 Tax=Elsinoe australis TaxID=40998 RepID=A0A2P7YW64_9PEZI|nr:hypothetical protein B9Z65_8145 [Elsinoe australis]
MSSRRYDYPTSRRDPNYEGLRSHGSKNDRHNQSPSPVNHAYPPPPSRPSTYRSSRRRWPPQPSVEEEAIALRKEHPRKGSQPEGEAACPGTIDQEPIIMDVTPSRNARQPQRSDKRTPMSSGVPTPPTSDDDDRATRARRHGPRLQTAAIPEMRRTPSPYANSTPTSMPGSSATISSASNKDKLYEAVKNVSAASEKSRSSAPFSTDSADRRTHSKAERRTPADSRPSSGVAIDDVEIDEDEAYLRRNERRSARYSFTKPILTAEPESIDQKDLPVRPSSSRRPLLSDDNRRHTDSWMEMPREQVVEAVRKPAPLKVASLVREASGQQSPASPNRVPSGTPPSRSSPRASSDDVGHYPPSPPRSPRVSQDRTRETSAPTQKRSHQSSVEGSRNNSPQASPKLSSTLPSSSNGWQGAFDSNTARTARPTTRLATATRPGEIPRSTANSAPVQRTESLPYPVDDFMASMPEERDHQYFPEGLRPVEASAIFTKTLSRAGTPLTTRPPLQKHQSYKDNSTAPTTPTIPPPSRTPRHVNFAMPSSTGSYAAAAIPIMKPCPRADYVSGYNDWYTLEDCPNFDICEPCLRANFRDNYHAAYFRPVHPSSRSISTKVRCDFSRQWIRLAWLLTLQRQLSNLSLLKAVYHLLQPTNSLPCPDIHVKPHTWYTVLDDATRRPITDLHICITDVRTIEILLPSLRGFFVPAPAPKGSRSSTTIDQTPHLCAFRSTNNNRFQIYLDSLISLHEAVAQSPGSRLPDMTPFVHLVKHKLELDECPRDNILQGARWFFVPSVPEFTVCEDCHDDMIAPLLRQDRDLAMRFNRSAQLLPASKEGRSARDSVNSVTDVAKEASCALYSNRMREVFMTAVEGNDLKLLSRVARQRREMEKELQRKAQPVIARIGEVDEGIARYEEEGRERDVRRLEGERERLEERLRRYQSEWAEWE